MKSYYYTGSAHIPERFYKLVEVEEGSERESQYKKEGWVRKELTPSEKARFRGGDTCLGDVLDKFQIR